MFFGSADSKGLQVFMSRSVDSAARVAARELHESRNRKVQLESAASHAIAGYWSEEGIDSLVLQVTTIWLNYSD